MRDLLELLDTVVESITRERVALIVAGFVLGLIVFQVTS